MESYLRDDDDKKPRGDSDKLTNREKEVLQLVAEGYTNNEIGNLMSISVKTVETHRAHIMSKLDIHDVAGLIKYAIRKGLVLLDSGK
jgi:DNA-binding NarL/FixJ family response regulator